MTREYEIGRAIAFFESSEDTVLLHQLLSEVAAKAKKLVARLLASNPEESLPAPAHIAPASEPASRQEALRTLRTTGDFSLLQSMARAIGERLEAMEIVASAEFPPGARVMVPEKPTFPPREPTRHGKVESTGTSLRVLLDDGATWEGPPSLARLERPA